MAINNPLLYNAAQNGFVRANAVGRGPFVTENAGALATLAVSFAAAFDALIDLDATITTAGSPNATTEPTTGAITNAQISKSATAEASVFATFAGGQSAASGSFPSLAASAAALYSALTTAGNFDTH